MFLPEIAQIRYESSRIAPLAGTRTPNAWRVPLLSASVAAKGRTERGANVVVFAHAPTCAMQPESLRDAVTLKTYRGFPGRDKIPAFDLDTYLNHLLPINDAEFRRLLSLDGQLDSANRRKVWVLDARELSSIHAEDYSSVEEAMEHPLVVPLFGNTEIAERYLRAHENEYARSAYRHWDGACRSNWQESHSSSTPILRMKFTALRESRDDPGFLPLYLGNDHERVWPGMGCCSKLWGAGNYTLSIPGSP